MIDVGLVKQVNTYIRDNEEEAIKLIEQFKEEQLTLFKWMTLEIISKPLFLILTFSDFTQ